MLREKNMNEWRPRARHHAKKLEGVARMAENILKSGGKITCYKSRIRVGKTKETPTFIVRPYRERAGGGYVGIEIKEFGGKGIRLKVVD